MRRWAALALLIALAGCADHSERRPARTNPAPHAQPQPPPPPLDPHAEPFGRLSAAEKRAIVREYQLLQPLQNGRDAPAELAHGRRVCAALTSPQTTLVARVRADCRNAIRFFTSLRALEAVAHDCASTREYPTCEQARFLSMAEALRATSSGAAAINDELERRRITGLCADSIGITQPQLESYRRAEQAARNVAAALAAGNAVGLERGTKELSKALGEGSGGDPLRGIVRGCRTSKPKTTPLPTAPADEGINA